MLSDFRSVETEDMDEPQWENVEVQVTRGGAVAVSATAAEDLNSRAGSAVELQMPGLGIGFGVGLMQRTEQLEKLPALAMDSQLPVGPMP